MSSVRVAAMCACVLSCTISLAQLSFNPHQAAPLRSGSAIGAHGDFNGDGREDILETVYNPSTTLYEEQLFLSTADGTYDASKTLPAFVQAVGDFNHDGKLDFATQEASGPLSVYLGNGDGTFSSPKVIAPNSFVQSILAVDLNHDNKTDLVVLTGGVSNGGDLFSALQIWLSNGDGTFTKGQTINTSIDTVRTEQAASAVTGDFDGDGKPDIALIYGYVNNNSQSVSVPSTVQVWYGDGAGHLGSTPSYFADPNKNFESVPFVADLNNDGRSDIVLRSDALSPPGPSGVVAVLFGNSSRTLSYKQLGTGVCAGYFTAADFNGDGLNDIAYNAAPCSSSVATNVYVRLGTGSGNFGGAQNVYQNQFQIGELYAVRTTSGTKPDLVFDQWNGTTSDSFEILTNDSTGGFPGCGVSGKAEGISICSPGTSSNSPVKFSIGAAGPTPMRTVAVWADGKKIAEQLTHAFSNYSFLDSSVALTAGTHAVTVYGIGWDGTHQTKTFNLTVSGSSSCAAPSSAGINVCSPVSGSTVSSPVSVRAAARITGTLARMEIWVDGVKKYSETSSTSFSTSLSLAAGSHRFDIYAVNTSGTKWEKTVTATVK